MQISRGGREALWTEATSDVQAVSQEHASYVQGTARRVERALEGQQGREQEMRSEVTRGQLMQDLEAAGVQTE